jgi:hypothetical protein
MEERIHNQQRLVVRVEYGGEESNVLRELLRS